MKRLLVCLFVVALALGGCRDSGEKAPPEKKAGAPVEKKAEAPAEKVEAPAEKAEDPAEKAEDPAEKVEDPAEKVEDPAEKVEDPAEKAEDPAEKVEAPAEASGAPVVVLETSKGIIRLELTPEKTPVTVENFVRYVKDGHLDGTIFHRVVPGFVIQGGGFTEDFTEKPTREPIENEAALGIKNVRGTISMARTRERNSATSQFFISLKDNDMLDYRGEHPSAWGYAAFGRVIEGMDVVDTIAAIPTVVKGPFDRPEVPSETVLILKATVQP